MKIEPYRYFLMASAAAAAAGQRLPPPLMRHNPLKTHRVPLPPEHEDVIGRLHDVGSAPGALAGIFSTPGTDAFLEEWNADVGYFESHEQDMYPMDDGLDDDEDPLDDEAYPQENTGDRRVAPAARAIKSDSAASPKALAPDTTIEEGRVSAWQAFLRRMERVPLVFQALPPGR